MTQEMTLDSKVFFTIPGTGMESDQYRRWIEQDLLPGWLRDKEGNPDFRGSRTGDWNKEGGIGCRVGGKYIAYCKFYKIDEKDWYDNIRRGIMIRDHYSREDVEKVQFISARFEEYLKEKRIPYIREDAYTSR